MNRSNRFAMSMRHSQILTSKNSAMNDQSGYQINTHRNIYFNKELLSLVSCDN
jgi:hypothetical protein